MEKLAIRRLKLKQSQNFLQNRGTFLLVWSTIILKEGTVTERANYYVEKVRYNKGHTRILWVSVRQDSDTKLSGAYNMVRKKMVSLIRKEKQFITIFRSPEGKYRKGQKISIVRVKGADYLRTDQGEAEQDLLEDLPEY